jgi:hypothetical protein
MTEVRFRYETPSAFRKALKDRFGQIARADRRYSLDELQRQFAYDRVLARLFSSDDADRWVLKGAGALLARLGLRRVVRAEIPWYPAEAWLAAERCREAAQALDDPTMLGLPVYPRPCRDRLRIVRAGPPPGHPLRGQPARPPDCHRARCWCGPQSRYGGCGRRYG